MHLEDHGGSGPPLLLLHGLGSSGEDWSLMVDELAKTWRVLVPDVRGHGRSEKPSGAYSVPLFAGDIAALCDVLGLQKVHVVGISMGGMIGFQLAVDRPALVASLTVINSGPELVPRTWQQKLGLQMRVWIIKAFGPKALAKKLATALFPNPGQEKLRAEIEQRIGANEKDVYLRATKGLFNWSVEARIHQLEIPVLVLASEHDYTPVDFKRAYLKKLKHGRLEVIPGSRHAATGDSPGLLNAAISKFLGEVSVPVPLTTELSRLAARHPEKIAITCGDEQVTWGELDQRTNRLARAFTAHGVQKDSFVTIALPNSIAFYEAVIATWKVGATPQPASARMAAAERDAILELAKPSLVVGLSAKDCGPWKAFEPGSEATQSDASLPPVISSSFKAPMSGGSTGRPKLIISTQAATTDALSALAGHLRVQPGGVHLVTGPLSHNGPLLFSLCALFQGNQLVVMKRFDATEALSLVQRHRVDWMYAVPTMMQRIWRLSPEERAKFDLGSLKTVLHLAAPCPPWLKEAWISWLGPERVWELFAATEVQAITLISGTNWLTHRGSVGRPFIGELQILDAVGQRLPAGQVGEVWMRRGADQPGGPYRYLGAVPKQREGGWESVGDMGHLDAEGYLYLADRQTDMILVGGSNVYPAEVEAALEAHPSVSSACVVGLPDDDLGNAPHAIVQLANGVAELSDAVLAEHCRARLSSYKVPRTFERVTQPLRDEAGKVRRSALRAERLAAR
ncbi:MAG: alpha/beta fold hydrolase [Myxococcaceae bacterium]